jgi:hypothetical protein
MVTWNYLMMLGVGTVLALLLALAVHAAHAYLAMWPDLFWDWQLQRRSPEGRFQGADYDNMGYWEFASLRNFLLYAGSNLIFVWGPGYWFWDRQELVLANVCAAVAHVGIAPLFCS